MKLCTSMATALIVALALSGCDKNNVADETNASKENPEVGGISAQLTLPDDSEIISVNFNITGPGGYSNVGVVPVGNSTILTFRIGGIPVGPGYNIALTASTNFGNTCMGDTDFAIANNGTTLVNVILECGATDNEGDIIVNGEFESCPIITAITAIPGEITLGNAISLESEISHGTDPVIWTGAGGTFGTPNGYDTTFVCAVAGPHTLTVAVNSMDCNDARTVDVICTLGAGCGNGQLDAGEQCDDNNAVNTDGCTNTCRSAVCGDGIILAGTETCDDNNSITESCAPGQTSCTVCNATCQSVPGATAFCGDGNIGAGETCDDSNAVTEECAYGLASCSVCNSTCQTAAGDTDVCGDGTVDAPTEQCDGGAGCTATCTTVVNNCTPCRNTNCTNYQGVNWVLGCFDNTAAGTAARDAGGATFTPAQVQACVDAIACSDANVDNCAYNPLNPVNPCYCGIGTTVDFCSNAANAATGPCKTQWEAAAGTTTRGDVLLRMNDIGFPTGWAYYLLECDRLRCNAQCN